MTVGVITHLGNATLDEVRRLAVAAEEAGADWLGVPDAFWWRDTWLLLAEAARATSQIQLGPVVTNPYLRHPFHTISAIATLQEIAGPRVFVTFGAGGSEVTGAAGVSRRDAGARIGAAVSLLRDVADGQPLDAESGRRLEVPLSRPTVLVAGRGDGVLRAAGRYGDGVLLWAIPTSDLGRSIDVVRAGTAERASTVVPPELIWAPLVRHDETAEARIRTIAAYSVLNSSRTLQGSWGLSVEDVESLRTALVGGGAAAAARYVPERALDDLVLSDPAPEVAATVARRHGVGGIAIPAFDIESVPDQVAWARTVVERSRELTGASR